METSEVVGIFLFLVTLIILVFVVVCMVISDLVDS